MPTRFFAFPKPCAREAGCQVSAQQKRLQVRSVLSARKRAGNSTMKRDLAYHDRGRLERQAEDAPGTVGRPVFCMESDRRLAVGQGTIKWANQHTTSGPSCDPIQACCIFIAHTLCRTDPSLSSNTVGPGLLSRLTAHGRALARGNPGTLTACKSARIQ